MSNAETLLEAERRGLLPESKQALLEEAKRRGLIRARLEPTHRQAEEESMAALERDPPEIAVPSEVSRQTGGMIDRGTFVAATGITGGALGAPAGPPGVAAGGALGAMAGSYMFDLTENMVRAYTGKRPNPLTTDPVKQFETATGEGLVDIVVAGGLPLAGTMAKRGIGKILGTQSREARQVVAAAEKEGIRIGAQHVSPRKFVRGLPGTLGVFPFAGTPYREGQKRVVGDIDKRGAQLLNELAPSHSVFQLSKGLVDAAAVRYKKFNNIAGKLYDRFATMADDLSHPEIVNTDAIKEAVANIEGRQLREAIPLEGGKTLTIGDDALGQWITNLKDIPERITVFQARGLERQLNDILGNIKAGENFDTSRLFDIKGALEQAKLNIDLSLVDPTEAIEVLKAWRAANHFFHNTRKVFETETAKKLGVVDRNIFNSQIFKAGSKSADEMFETLVNAKSVTGLSDLRALVGPGRFKEAARGHLDRAFRDSVIKAPEGSVLPELFSAQKFSTKLGLDSPEGWEVLGELLKGSDVSVRQWQTFLEVASVGTDITIRSPSTFVMRRMILGAGLAGGILIGAGQISIPAAIVLTTAARRGASFMMNPRHLQDLTRIVLPTAPDLVRRAAMMRILREIVNDRKDSMEFVMDDGLGDEGEHRALEGAAQ